MAHPAVVVVLPPLELNGFRHDKRNAFRWSLQKDEHVPNSSGAPVAIRLVVASDRGTVQHLRACPQRVAEHIELLDTRGDASMFDPFRGRQIFFVGTEWDTGVAKGGHVFVVVLNYYDEAWNVGWKELREAHPDDLFAFFSSPV